MHQTQEVVTFPLALIMLALASPHASEVRANGEPSVIAQRSRQAEGNLVPSTAPQQRLGVRNERDALLRRPGNIDQQLHVSLSGLEQGGLPARGLRVDQ